jgi:hypothetical protein
MTYEQGVSALIVSVVLLLASLAAVLTANDRPLKVGPAPAVSVPIASPCVFLAYDPALNAYVCLDGAAAPLPTQSALVPASSFLLPSRGAP